MKDRSILIIQEEVPHYRVPFFSMLARQEGNKVTIAHSSKSLKSDGAGFDEKRLNHRKFAGFSMQMGLRQLVSNADLVIAPFNIRFLSIIPLLLFHPRKVILWGHGFGENRFLRKIRLFFAKRAAALILYEKHNTAEFIDLGCDKRKVFYAGNTVHVPNAGLRANPKINFLYVGRLQSRKRIDLLLKAFASVEDQIPETIGIKIVGDGDIKQDLEALSTRLGISKRVDFLNGVFGEEELAEVFGDAIAYVSPGHVGLGVLHSFAYGVPVITVESARHAPEVHNIQDGVNGYIYKGDESQLAKLLVHLSLNQNEVSLLGTNAFNYYNTQRSMIKMVERVDQAISFVCMGKRQG